MDQEFIKPDSSPKGGQQAFGQFGSFIAAAGATLLTFSLIGSAITASVWAFAKVLGLPDGIIQWAIIAAAIPVLIITFWTAGRAWHVEQRLGRGLDVDRPVFSMMHYWRKAA